jgi:hypothetical protein
MAFCACGKDVTPVWANKDSILSDAGVCCGCGKPLSRGQEIELRNEKIAFVMVSERDVDPDTPAAIIILEEIRRVCESYNDFSVKTILSML